MRPARWPSAASEACSAGAIPAWAGMAPGKSGGHPSASGPKPLSQSKDPDRRSSRSAAQGLIAAQVGLQPAPLIGNSKIPGIGGEQEDHPPQKHGKEALRSASLRHLQHPNVRLCRAASAAMQLRGSKCCLHSNEWALIAARRPLHLYNPSTTDRAPTA
jgi:hypothetical protein